MNLEQGNAYSFKLNDKQFGGLFISDVYIEYRGGINLSIVLVDFELNEKPKIIDFANSNTIKLTKNILPEENEKHLEIKSYNIWKEIFEGIEELTFIGKMELKEFESITTPISTQNTGNHLKNEFLKFYDTCEEIKKWDDNRYTTIPIIELIKTKGNTM